MRPAGLILPAVAALALALVACGPGAGSTGSAVPASSPPSFGSVAPPSESGQQIVGSLGFLQDLGDLDPVPGAEIAKIPSCAEFAR